VNVNLQKVTASAAIESAAFSADGRFSILINTKNLKKQNYIVDLAAFFSS